MKLNVNFNKPKPDFSEESRKAISLLYFDEALRKEEYEDCARLVEAAKRFGAQQSEIDKVIAAYLGKGKGLKRNEAKARSMRSAVGRRF